MKKIIALILCLVLALGSLAGCAKEETPATQPTAEVPQATKPVIPSVRLLVFQPELTDGWESLAGAYTANTGVPVSVVACDSKNWEQTLASHLEDEDAPTIYQIFSPTGTEHWQGLCHDLTRTDAAKALVSKSYALSDGDALLALPDSVDAWGIWVNRTLLEQTPFTLEDIASQTDLKTIAEAVTTDSQELGFAAFAPLEDEDLLPLAAAAIAREFQLDSLKSPHKFRGTQVDGLTSLLALIGQNSAGSQAFAEGKTLFCLGSSADWAELSSTFKPEELALIPVYLDETEVPLPVEDTDEAAAPQPTEATVPEEETQDEDAPDPQGLLIGAQRFWCINPQAPAQDLEVTLDFLNWLLGSEAGAAALAELNGDLPYTTAPEITNPFLPEWGEKDNLYRRDWAMPSYQWQTALFRALKTCMEDPTDENRTAAAEVFSGYWAAEYALSGAANSNG